MSIWTSELTGKLHHESIDSALLRDNPLGDPHVRPLWIYTPPGYEQGDTRYPSIYVIQDYSGQVTMWGNRQPFRESFIEATDRLFAEQRAPGCVLVFVDASRRPSERAERTRSAYQCRCLRVQP